MVDPTTVGTLVVAGVASCFMAWAIGAGSSGSTPFAPAVGANAISVMRAGFFVGILGFAGATLQGANVSEAVGRELIRGVTISPIAATVALATAATIVAIGIFTGYPIATAFTVTGAVIGVGLAAGGLPAWAKYQQIGTLWVLVPFVGGGVAFATAKLLDREGLPDRNVIPFLGGVVGLIIAKMDFAALGPAGDGGSIAGVISRAAFGQPTPALGETAGTIAVGILTGGALWVAIRRDETRAKRQFLLALGALVAFSAGGSQVGLAIGPLLPLLLPLSVPLWAILVGGGLGLLVGSWTGAPRMIKALSQDYSSLGPRRSIAALIPSFAIAQTAVFFGIPVSFNEIIVSAIVGSGYAHGSSGVSGRKMGYTVLAWIGSLFLATGVGFGAFRVARVIVALV
jgi:PiT family inorganic phosphate transporter